MVEPDPDWAEYERRKREIRLSAPTQEDYDRLIKDLIEELGV